MSKQTSAEITATKLKTSNSATPLTANCDPLDAVGALENDTSMKRPAESPIHFDTPEEMNGHPSDPVGGPLLSSDAEHAQHGHDEMVAILDCGAQYGKVIDRRVRELNVLSSFFPLDVPVDELKKLNCK